MREYVDKKTVIERKVCSKIVCDLCGTTAGRPDYPDWASSCYDVEETVVRVEVKSEVGSAYPEGGRSTEIASVDICPDCFERKLIPWLESQGAKVRRRDT